MADNKYIIPYSDGRKGSIDVDENTTNVETPLSLIGHGLSEYGDEQNTNFLHLLENFASPEPEESEKEEESYILKHPVQGQLWYRKPKINDGDVDTTKFELCVYDGKDWIPLTKIISANGLNPSDMYASVGQIGYDTSDEKLKVFTGDSWLAVGPVDTTHTETVADLRFINSGGNYCVGTLPHEKITDDIEYLVNLSDEEKTKTGSLHMIKMDILAKEFVKNTPSPADTIDVCGWKYTVLLRSKKTGTSSYVREIVGEPNYELIGKSKNNLLWNISNINFDASGNLLVYFNTNNVVETNHCIAVKFIFEISKV